MLNNKLFNDSGRSSRLAMGKCREKNKAQVRTCRYCYGKSKMYTKTQHYISKSSLDESFDYRPADRGRWCGRW